MVKWVIIAVLLLPVVEIAVFVIVAAFIGVFWTLALMLFTTVAGVTVLRRSGRGQIARMRVAVADTDKTWIEANTGGAMTVLAGVLLFLPGFLTDLLGAALLIGPLRRRFGSIFRRWVRSRDQATSGVIDLEPQEWRQVPDPRIKNDSSKRPRH